MLLFPTASASGRGRIEPAGQHAKCRWGRRGHVGRVSLPVFRVAGALEGSARHLAKLRWPIGSASTVGKASPACAFTGAGGAPGTSSCCASTPDRRKDPAEQRARLLNAADVAFLCLPDAAARETAAPWSATAHLPDRRQHRAPHRPRLVFGLPELAPGQRERIRTHPAHRQPRLPRHRLRGADAALVDAGLVPAALPVVGNRRSPATRVVAEKMIEQYQATSLEPALTSPRTPCVDAGAQAPCRR